MAVRTPTNKEVEALVEYSLRRNMSTSMFRPMEHQEPFFRNYAREFLLRGGVRCSAKGTTVWACEPSKFGHKSKTGLCKPRNERPINIEDVEVGDSIVGVSFGKRKNIVLCKVSEKTQFSEEGHKLTTKRGYTLIGTHDHPVLACPPLPPRYNNSVDPDWKQAKWVKLSEMANLDGWYVQMAFGCHIGWNGDQDEDAYVHGLMHGDGSVECYDYGVCKLAGHKDENLIPDMQRKLTARSIHSRVFKSSENGVSLEWCNLEDKQKYMSWNPGWNPSEVAGYICGLMDADGTVSEEGKVSLSQTDAKERNRFIIHWVHKQLLLFGIRSSLRLYKANKEQGRPNDTWRLTISGYSVKRYRDSIGFREIGKAMKLTEIAGKRRKPVGGTLWWDRVKSVKTCGETDFVAISTTTENYVSNGIVSHNSGKSTCAAMKFAMTAMDLDVTYEDGTSHTLRQPWQKGKCLRMWIIGYDSKHIGQTIYRLLFKPGLFKIIKDLNTGLYRAYRPWEEEDKKREKEAKASPALIPSRYIKPNSWDWENKKGKEFKSVVIRDPITGDDLAEIYAFSSKADPKAGDPVDMIWIDEAIENPSHYEEWKSRLFDVRGSLIWSSWPNVQNDALANLTQRALEQANKESPLVRETVISLSANKTIDKETLDEALGMFATPEERRARDKGEYVTDLLRMYPIFDEYLHQAVRDGDPDKVSRVLRENGGIPPLNWTRELIIDPGSQHPAALFCAIPPPDLVDQGTECFVVYDELAGDSVRQHDATKLAKKIREKAGGIRFNRMIIDMQGGRQHGMGYEISTATNYREALERERVLLETGDPYFIPGSADVGGRIGQLQRWMHPQRQNELPTLRIVRASCPNLIKQLREYKKACVNNYVKDDRPAPNQHIDAAVCLEYWASTHPCWIEPRFIPREGGIVAKVIALRDSLRRRKSSGGQIGPQYS